MQSNDVRKLQEMNVHVWDEWMREDGTIGKAYRLPNCEVQTTR